jgi:hypothetical protein
MLIVGYLCGKDGNLTGRKGYCYGRSRWRSSNRLCKTSHDNNHRPQVPPPTLSFRLYPSILLQLSSLYSLLPIPYLPLPYLPISYLPIPYPLLSPHPFQSNLTTQTQRTPLRLPPQHHESEKETPRKTHTTGSRSRYFAATGNVEGE